MFIRGFCPAQGKDYVIDIEYIDASTLEKKQSLKGCFSCDYNAFGDKCNGNNCPIYESAPDYK